MRIRSRKRKDGSTVWDGEVFLGRDPETGKERMARRTFERKKDLAAWARKLEHQKDLGMRHRPTKDTLAQYVRRWLDDSKRQQVRQSTYKGYDWVTRCYLESPPDGAPPLGQVRLDRVTAEGIERFYASLQREHGTSASTIRAIHEVIRPALRKATKTGACARNAATLVDLPKQPKPEIRAMTAEEAQRFLEAAKDDRYAALWMLLLTGGLRPSEAFALRWRDVDLGSAKVRVEHSLVRVRGGGWKLNPPKTSRSRRTVVVPAFVAEALQAWRKEQAAEQLAAGAGYEDHGFVFTTPGGTPLELSNFKRGHFNPVMARAGIGTWGPEPKKPPRGPTPNRKFEPGYTLYQLRHTCATLLLRQGEHPKVISERLGHASVGFTLDTYSASLPDMQQSAAERLQTLLASSDG